MLTSKTHTNFGMKMKFKKGVKCCVLDIKYVKKTKKKGEVKLLKDPKIVKI